MRHYVGLSENDLIQMGLDTPIFYEPHALINAHMLVSGMSGTGKSFQMMGFLSSAIEAGIEIDVFDAHDEFENLPGAAVAVFSQATGYGYNPLVLDTNPHTGGVNSQVDFFVRLIKNVTPHFGVKQEAALRNLLIDTYAVHGIFQERPQSWHKHSILESQRQEFIVRGELGELYECYPTMEALKDFAKSKLLALSIGLDNKCVTTFEVLHKLRKRLVVLQKSYERALSKELMQDFESKIENQQCKCVDAYTEFISSPESGQEAEDILKYDSVDVLRSVLQRITLLSATGILNANEPPFGNSMVRVHQMKSICNEQQILYVKLRLQAIFERWKKKGTVLQASPPRHIVFLEEAHNYFTEDAGDIVNIIAKEGRKFGLGLWCASQQPTVFPESFLTNCGSTLLLGIHTAFWRRAVTMFRISEKTLRGVKPKEVMVVKFLQDGCVDPPFLTVVVPNPNTEMGRRAIAMR